MALDPISVALDIGGKLIDRLWPDPAQRDAAKLELLKMQQSGDLAQLAADTDLAKGQMAVNAAEAANPSLFVSGWRPFIGWVCGAAFAGQYVVAPLVTFGLAIHGTPVQLPVLDVSTMMPLLFGMLGLGGMRTAEKISRATK